MRGGVKLSLYLGPVPIPAPHAVVDALSSVKVEAGAGDVQSGFELVFEMGAHSPLHTLFLLSSGGGQPFMRVVLVVTINGRAEPLIDGVATNIESQPGQGGATKLVVKGKDISAAMDIEARNGESYPAAPPAVRVLQVLARYAALGIVPKVVPSLVEDVPLPMKEVPQQRGTDYAYIKHLAEKCGYVFFLEPGPMPGMSTAYWGPEIRIGAPQPALTTNMDAMNNVDELSFNFDKERKTLPIVFFQDTNSKMSIGVPIPDVTPLNPPLGLVPPLPPKQVNLDNTARLSAATALMTGLAYAAQHSDSVFGTGKLDVARYGRMLRSRRLVGVRGAGVPYDGLYYVTKVSHDIKRGEYKQGFSLARNGLVSTIPRVPT
jgi:hypothetical protein